MNDFIRNELMSIAFKLSGNKEVFFFPCQMYGIRVSFVFFLIGNISFTTIRVNIIVPFSRNEGFGLNFSATFGLNFF